MSMQAKNRTMQASTPDTRLIAVNKKEGKYKKGRQKGKINCNDGGKQDGTTEMKNKAQQTSSNYYCCRCVI